MRYDPLRTPDAEQWLDLDEMERNHRRARIKLPNPRLHATLHVIVENQILLADETPVAATLERLLAEGLDRHDAIHAIASVLSGAMFDTIKSTARGDLNSDYFRGVSELTAQRWRARSD